MSQAPPLWVLWSGGSDGRKRKLERVKSTQSHVVGLQMNLCRKKRIELTVASCPPLASSPYYLTISTAAPHASQ